MLFGGNTTKSNVGVRFLNRHFYTLLGFGLYYRGLDDHFSGALFYRAGYRHSFSPRFALSADLGLAHIEDSPADAEKTELRRLAFQARLNAEYRIASQLSFFATGGGAARTATATSKTHTANRLSNWGSCSFNLRV